MRERTDSIIADALSLEVERAWVAESERRIDAHEHGEEPTVSYERMKRELTDR